MYNCAGQIMHDDEMRKSQNLGFWEIVGDKELVDFFYNMVSGEVSAFHSSFLRLAETPNNPLFYNKGIADGFRTVADRLVPESRNCSPLDEYLNAMIQEGKLENSESEKDAARKLFILTFIEDHKLS